MDAPLLEWQKLWSPLHWIHHLPIHHWWLEYCPSMEPFKIRNTFFQFHQNVFLTPSPLWIGILSNIEKTSKKKYLKKAKNTYDFIIQMKYSCDIPSYVSRKWCTLY